MLARERTARNLKERSALGEDHPIVQQSRGYYFVVDAAALIDRREDEFMAYSMLLISDVISLALRQERDGA